MSRENPFLLPLSIPVAVSPRLIRLLYAVALGAGLAIWISAATVIIKSAASLLLLLYIALLRRRLQSNRAHDPRQITLLHDNSWRIITHAGETLPATQGRAIFIHRDLIVLPLHYNRRKKILLLTPDSLDNTLLRRLRVRLQYLSDQPPLSAKNVLSSRR